VDLPFVTGFRFQMLGTNRFTAVQDFPPAFSNEFEVASASVGLGVFTNGQNCELTGQDPTGVGEVTVRWAQPLAKSSDAASLAFALAFTGSNATVQMDLLAAPGPRILADPVGGLFPVGASVTLACAASSDSPIRYQWQFRGTNLVAATNALLVIPNLLTSGEGDYRVTLVDAQSAVTSAVAQVRLAPGSLIPPLLSRPTMTWQGFALQLQTESGKGYRIQTSANLRAWIDRTNFIGTGSTFRFVDAEVPPTEPRFYRAVSP
jgi:hypothetical protein